MARLKFKNYIKENVSIDGTDYRESEIQKFMKWWDNIEKDCKHWLDEIRHNNPNKHLVYRGTNSISGDFTEVRARKDRFPKDMTPEWHNALDDVFNKKYGWKPRSEGVFCGRSEMAKNYGDLYIIFPIGRYKYLWSEKYYDLYETVNEITIEPSEEEYQNWHNEWEDQYGEGQEGEWYHEGYTTNESDVDDAVAAVIKDRIEQLEEEIEDLEEGSDEYEEIKKEIDYLNSTKAEKDIEKALEWEPSMSKEDYVDSCMNDYTPDEDRMYDEADTIIEDGKYTNRDIIKGIDLKKEIMLGCDKYYVISASYESLIKKCLFERDFNPDQLSFDF